MKHLIDTDWGRITEALQNAHVLLKEYLDNTGGCDHSVGVCCCDIRREVIYLERLLKDLEIRPNPKERGRHE